MLQYNTYDLINQTLINREIGNITMKIITRVIIIVGPVGVSNNIDEYSPKTIEKIPIKEEKIAIWTGDLEICFADAAGIINIEVTSKIPTILTQVATKIINKVKKTPHIRLVLTFSALAIFSLIVNKTSLFHIKDKTIKTKIVAKTNHNNSEEVTVKISPNKYESKLTLLFNKLIETIPIDRDECARIPSNVSLDKILLLWRYTNKTANKQQMKNVPIVVLMPKAIPNAIPKRLLCDKESPK